jgi:hypothetical protein
LVVRNLNLKSKSLAQAKINNVEKFGKLARFSPEPFLAHDASVLSLFSPFGFIHLLSFIGTVSPD